MCTLYTSFLQLPQNNIYGLRAPTKKTISTLCPDCTDSLHLLKYSVCTMYGLYTPSRIHSVHYEGLVRTLQSTQLKLWRIVCTTQYTLYILFTNYTHPPEYSSYTLYGLYVPSRIHCVHHVRIIRTLQNTVRTLRKDCAHPAEYTVYTMHGLYIPSRI